MDSLEKNTTAEPNNRSGFDAVIFDFDGTLYDKKGIEAKMILKNFRHLRLLYAEEKARRKLQGHCFENEGAFYDTFFGRIAKSCSISKKEVETWYFHDYLASIVEILRKDYSARKGTDKVLKKIELLGIPAFIYSDCELVDEKLSAIGENKQFFKAMHCSAEFGGLKPCGEALLKMLKTYNLKGKNILLVGDSNTCDRPLAGAFGMKYFSIERDEDMLSLFAEISAN